LTVVVRYPRVLAALAVAVALGACAPGTRAASPAGASLTAASAPAPATVAASEADAPAADDPAGPRYALIAPTAKSPVVHTGDDWTLPAWVRPAPFTGFFSEDASPANHVPVRSIDVTWRQIAPTPDGPLDLNATGKAQGMRFEPLGEQLAASGPYWVRIFASGVDWAPAWVATTCHVKGIGPDYDHELHLPIWNDCVWSALRDTWRKLLIDTGVLADPDFRFAYVPGAFTWVEFDYDIISTAAARGLLTKDQYLTWYGHMLDDLAAIAGPQVGQLVFTGEDYPWGPFGGAENLLAAAAVGRGFGVRTGITEEFDFHLNETPAYGSRIEPDGHLTLTRADPTGLQAFATENECYRACGYHAKSLGYAIVHSNLKALQLQLNWLYVVPEDSYLSRYAAHWDWVRAASRDRGGRVGRPARRAGHLLERRGDPRSRLDAPSLGAEPRTLAGAGGRARGRLAPLEGRRAQGRSDEGERHRLRGPAHRPGVREPLAGVPARPAVPPRRRRHAGAGEGDLPRQGQGQLPAATPGRHDRSGDAA
jgi:hypothetical protein